MAVCKSVKRRVRLDGPCRVWFPLVRDSLCARGFRNVAADESLFRLTADYGDPPVCGGISVTLAPSALCGGTEMSVVVTADLGGASALPVEGGTGLW